ncbi:MAG: TRAP transporter small permease [Limimaricola soesokkakensis]|uniref:TRAP transporter small permease n=1 Tax=Limimaricola soesokkakensis TaxID=1343159 RepID=UPI004059CE62
MTWLKWSVRHLEEFICCLGLTVIATCVFLQVVMRFGFDAAPHWTEEVTAICMVWSVYMGAALCVRERFHIRILVLVSALPERLGRGVIVAADLAIALYSLMMIRVSLDYLAVLWRYPSYTTSLGINEFYPQTILVIGYLLIALRIVQAYHAWWRGGAEGFASIRPEDLGLEPPSAAIAPDLSRTVSPGGAR